MESFYLGCCFGYFARIVTLKMLKWPLTAMPLRSIPPIFLMGVIFSGMDMLRRLRIEELMLREERAEINKELRQNDKHYDL